MNLTELLALAESAGLTCGDLDEAVHDLAQEVNLAELNTIEDEDAQDEHISSVEADASAINNGGLDEQLGFLLEHLGPEETEAVVRRLILEPQRSNG